MKRIVSTLLLAALLTAVAACTNQGTATEDASFKSTFAADKTKFASKGTGKYFALLPGYKYEYTNKAKEVLIITVTDKTKLVDGVETRVIEERETDGNGKLAEISQNYFAIDNATGDVYYFGEDVDIYDAATGKVKAHDGAWLSGVKGAKYGLMMPGAPKLGDKFQIEVAEATALDRAEIVSITETFKTPAGEFKNCIKVKETSKLEPGTVEYKIFAPGVGLVLDDDMILQKVTKP